MIPEVRQAVCGQLRGLTIFLYLCERKKRYGENWRIKYSGEYRTEDWDVGKLWLPLGHARVVNFSSWGGKIWGMLDGQ